MLYFITLWWLYKYSIFICILSVEVQRCFVLKWWKAVFILQIQEYVITIVPWHFPIKITRFICAPACLSSYLHAPSVPYLSTVLKFQFSVGTDLLWVPIFIIFQIANKLSWKYNTIIHAVCLHHYLINSSLLILDYMNISN